MSMCRRGLEAAVAGVALVQAQQPSSRAPCAVSAEIHQMAMEWNLSAAACSLPGRVTGRLNPPASSASHRMIQIQVTCLDLTYWMLALGDLMPYMAILHGLALLQR